MAAVLQRTATRPLMLLNEHVRARPLTCSIAVTAGKAAAADLVVQTLVEQKGSSQLDWRRTTTFFIFGGCYQGCFQYFVFNNFFDWLWPSCNMVSKVKKILAANLITDPLFFFPTFYTLKESIETKTLRPATVSTALSKYYDNYLIDWRNTWAVWFPGHIVTFALPQHLRMPWIASVSFCYTSILSYTRGDSSEQQPPRQEAES